MFKDVFRFEWVACLLLAALMGFGIVGCDRLGSVQDQVLSDEVIDTEAPTVFSVSLVQTLSRRQISVFFSEPVFSADGGTLPAYGDFVVTIAGVSHPIETIAGLAASRATADNHIKIWLSFPAPKDVQTVLEYSGTGITDVDGNPVVRFSAPVTEGWAPIDPPSVNLTLGASSDTGFRSDDGITNADIITLTVDIGDREFKNGDTVRIYIRGILSPVYSCVVSSVPGSTYNKDVSGKSTFTVDIPGVLLVEGVNILFATYTPVGLKHVAALPGDDLIVIYDTTAPVVTVHLTNQHQPRVVLLASDNDTEETRWVYKQIPASVPEGAWGEEMSWGTTLYTEGAALVFDSADDNGTRVIFVSADAAGNVGYHSTEVLQGIGN